ncbi:RHS repeat-associated core domain-containing protein, partial [Acinetobacter bereziniae]|uniref:RHS repeat-associated core domain-containing protein n=2 Tax=Acinetobacter bereziniae TaxID=106648 RepID=UPI0029538C6F
NSQLSKASNTESQIDFYRNPLGQLVREHQHYKVPNLPALSAVLRYEYDELGNLTQTIRPDGQVQANLSYGSGHIYGIAFNQQDMVAFQRDDLHRETTRLLANGLVQNKNYNDMGLLSSQIIRHEQETLDQLQQPQLQQAKHQAERHYHYDNNYLLTQVDDSRLGKLSYQYDPIGRLIKAQNPYSSESFSFDPAGNLIDPIATQTSQVKNNLISQYQGKHYKYDAQGNVIETSQSGQILKLTWDNLNRLIQSDHNGQITNYGYDVFGRRLYKHSLNDAKTAHSSELTLFGWDGDLMIWESYKTNSNQLNKQNYTKHYVYEPDSFVPLLQTGYTRFIQLIETPDYRQFLDVPYSIYKDPVWKTDTQKNKAELERVAFYHCDQVGTPQTLSNELGECIWEIKQDTWGAALEIKAIEQDNPFGHSNIRFQGQYYDKETGLHYNRYRYYEPYSARYVSKDPIGLFGGLNNSAYVSDPNQWVDPMGLMTSKSDQQRNQEILERIKQQRKAIDDENKKYNDWAKSSNEQNRNNYEQQKLQIEKQKQKAELKRIMEGDEFYRDVICDNIPSARQPGGIRSQAVLGKNAYRHLCPAVNSQFIDYLVCSSSIGAVGKTEVINLHNGQIWSSLTMDPIEAAKSINKAQSYKNKLSLNDVGKKSINNKYKLGGGTLGQVSKIVKEMGGASCMAGHIVGKNQFDPIAEQTDNFLGGWAVSVSSGKLVKVGVTIPLNSSTLSSSGTFGIEGGVGFGSNGVSFSYGEKSENFSLFDFVDQIRK